MTPVGDPRLGAALVDSDCRYFELGADVADLGGAVVASITGLEHLAAACVVQRVEPARFGVDSRRWVGAVVDRLAAMGCSTARVYLTGPAPSVQDALADAGFGSRVEIGYAVDAIDGGVDVTLRPVDDEEGWEAKRKLHAGSATAADGHRASADDWVELERRKHAAGGMDVFLIDVDGEVCGGVSTLDAGPVLRAKNLFVHPDRRRQGMAAGAMRALAERARAAGKDAVGIFGVPGNPGDALYRRLGMQPVVRQFEWSRSLSC